MPKKKMFFVLGLGIMIAITGAVGAQTPAPAATPTLSLDEVVAKIQANYDKVETYQINFNQQLFSPQQDRVLNEGSGTVKFKKPGKLVWSYEKPEEHTYVTDGATVYEYIAAQKVVNIWNLEEASYRSFLLGFGNLSSEFKVSFHEGTPKTDGGLYQLDLVPKDPKEKEIVGTVTFFVDPEFFVVRYAETMDPFGNNNRLQFKDIKANEPIPDSVFVYTPPPGVKVNNYKGK